MAIGERIRHFRKLSGMTMERLGETLGYSKRTAHVRLSQYENGVRGPKQELVDKLSDIFDVSPHALTVPDIDSYVGLTHTLFAMEDLYGLQVDYISDNICITLDKQRGQTYIKLYGILLEWQEQRAKYEAGEITKEEYDHWRYNYPESTIKK